MNIFKYLTPLFIAPILTFSQSVLAQNRSPDLNQELTMYVKPSVVRIVSKCAVDYKYWINRGDYEYKEIPHDLSFIGTGFIINPNGYIVTSSKVFRSQEDCHNNLLRNVQKTLKRNNIDLTLEDIRNQKDIGDFVPRYEQHVFLPYPSNNPVIFENHKPLEVKMSARDSGKPFEADKDIAIVKVALKNAPVLKLGDSSKVEIQEQILVVGYPNADLSEDFTQKSYLEASVQEGKISNPNKEIIGGYPILQIDTRITDGSAGSPVIDNKGEVIGLIKSRKNLDNSSYIPLAMPTSQIQEFIRQSGATNEQGETDALYIQGLQNFWKGNYREAKANFLKVKALYPFHSEVERLIGEIDQIEAEWWSKPWTNPAYIFAFALLIGGGIVGTVAYFLLRQRPQLAGANGGSNGNSTSSNSVYTSSTSSYKSNGKGKKCFLEMEYKGQIQRFQLNKGELRLGRDPNWSDFDIPSTWEVISRRHAIFQKEGDDYRIYDGDLSNPSRNGVWVSDDLRVDLERGHLLNNGDRLKIGQDAHEQVLITYFNPNNTHANPRTTMAN